MMGDILNQKWEIGAKHALFHRDGFWYHELKRFPGAYLDSAGYILFNTEKEYKSSQYLLIGKTVYIRSGGIRFMPGYKKVDHEPLFQEYKRKEYGWWGIVKKFFKRIFVGNN